MTQLTKWGLLVLGLVALLLAVGCGKNDGTSSDQDPELQAFDDQFDDMDEVSSKMFGMPFMFLDSVMALGAAQSGAARVSSSADATLSLDWHSESQFWYCTYSDAADGVSFFYVDSIQFRHGENIVQWPHEDSLTQISSFASMAASGDDVDTAYGFQNMIVSQYEANPELALANGSGSFSFAISEADCSVGMTFGMAASQIVFDPETAFDDSAGECPLSGTLTYTGEVDMTCTGENNIDISGAWTVTQAFSGGQVTVTYSDGTKTWTVTADCGDSEPPEGDSFGAADSLFIEESLGGENFESPLKALMVSEYLAEAQFGQPASARPAAFSPANLDDDITIESITSYEYQNGWHIWDFSATVYDSEHNDTSYVSGTDSVMWLTQDDPVADPIANDSLIDEVRLRAHVAVTSNDQQNGGTLNIAAIFALVEEGQTPYLQIDAESHEVWESMETFDEDGQCEVRLEYDLVIDGVLLQPDHMDQCPAAGGIGLTADFDIDCTQGSSSLMVDGTWTVTATANGDNTVTMSFNNGQGISWSAVTGCGDEPSSTAYTNIRW